jgi:hypothetical protein
VIDEDAGNRFAIPFGYGAVITLPIERVGLVKVIPTMKCSRFSFGTLGLPVVAPSLLSPPGRDI